MVLYRIIVNIITRIYFLIIIKYINSKFYYISKQNIELINLNVYFNLLKRYIMKKYKVELVSKDRKLSNTTQRYFIDYSRI
jgi:hypothetical protein